MTFGPIRNTLLLDMKLIKSGALRKRRPLQRKKASKIDQRLRDYLRDLVAQNGRRILSR